MSIKKITESEMAAVSVSSLPNRPTSSAAFGGRGLTAAQFKESFDKLPKLIAERLNALIDENDEADYQGKIGTLQTDVESLKTGKLDKFAATGNSYAYISKGDGTQGQMPLTASGAANSVMMTDSSGRSRVNAPFTEKDITNKAYVDAADTALQTGITAAEAEIVALQSEILPMQHDIDTLYKIVSQTVVTDTEVEDTYTARVAAGGLNIVDGAPTAVHKIRGATVASKNLLDESQLLPWTLPAEGAEDSKEIPFTIAAGTYTLYTKLTDSGGSEPQPSGVFYVYLRDDSGNTIVDCTANTSPEYMPNDNATFSVTAEQSQSISHLYVYWNHIDEAGLSGATIDYLMLNEGETNLPHEAYYAGVRQAYFKGIVSTGRNLITSLVTDSFTSNGVTVTPDATTGTLTIHGTPTGTCSGRLSQNFYLPKGTYTVYAPHRSMRYIAFYIRNTSDKSFGGLNWSADAGRIYGTVTITESGYYYLYMYVPGGYSVSFDNYVETPMLLPGAVTSDFPAFETYKSDVTFALNEAVQLGKWDYIDVDRQKIATGMAILTQETPFTDEQLTQYSDYILSADRKTVAYKTETATETDITLPSCYTAYRGGLETVEQGDTDNSAFGAENTVTQNYYVIAGGDEA